MVRITREQDVTIVELGKSYDSLSSSKLDEARRRLLHEADHTDPPLLVLDFARTEFMGSSFIELLVRAWKRVKHRDGQLVLCCVGPFCEEIFRVSRLDQLWEMVPTRREAVEMLRGKSG